MRFALFAAILSVVLVDVAPGTAAPRDRKGAGVASEYSAQARQRVRRPTRIVVYPRELYPYPCRNYAAAFVLPYDFECPGPKAVRHCTFRLAQEYRTSGTVIVPRQSCWWARR